MLRSPELAKKLARYSKMELKDLYELFEWIDHDKSGTIDVQEFLEGFRWINEPLRSKCLVKVAQRVEHELHLLKNKLTKLIKTRLKEVTEILAEPLEKVD